MAVTTCTYWTSRHGRHHETILAEQYAVGWKDNAMSEPIIQETEIRAGTLTPWVTAKLTLTDKQVTWEVPKTFFGMKVGSKTITQPLDRIANVSIRWPAAKTGGIVVALLGLLLILLAGWWSGTLFGVLFIVLGTAGSASAAMKIFDKGGRSRQIAVSLLDRDKLEDFVHATDSQLIAWSDER